METDNNSSPTQRVPDAGDVDGYRIPRRPTTSSSITTPPVIVPVLPLIQMEDVPVPEAEITIGSDGEQDEEDLIPSLIRDMKAVKNELLVLKINVPTIESTRKSHEFVEEIWKEIQGVKKTEAERFHAIMGAFKDMATKKEVSTRRKLGEATARDDKLAKLDGKTNQVLKNFKDTMGCCERIERLLTSYFAGRDDASGGIYSKLQTPPTSFAAPQPLEMEPCLFCDARNHPTRRCLTHPDYESRTKIAEQKSICVRCVEIYEDSGTGYHRDCPQQLIQCTHCLPRHHQFAMANHDPLFCFLKSLENKKKRGKRSQSRQADNQPRSFPSASNPLHGIYNSTAPSTSGAHFNAGVPAKKRR